MRGTGPAQQVQSEVGGAAPCFGRVAQVQRAQPGAHRERLRVLLSRGGRPREARPSTPRSSPHPAPARGGGPVQQAQPGGHGAASCVWAPHKSNKPNCSSCAAAKYTMFVVAPDQSTTRHGGTSSTRPRGSNQTTCVSQTDERECEHHATHMYTNQTPRPSRTKRRRASTTRPGLAPYTRRQARCSCKPRAPAPRADAHLQAAEKKAPTRNRRARDDRRQPNGRARMRNHPAHMHTIQTPRPSRKKRQRASTMRPGRRPTREDKPAAAASQEHQRLVQMCTCKLQRRKLLQATGARGMTEAPGQAEPCQVLPGD